MLVPLAAMWAPTAIGVGLAGAVLLVMIWRIARDDGPGASEDPDADGGGGGWWQRRRPRRPPPVGPVSWLEFERQFAAYVETGRVGPGDEPRFTRDPERAATAGRHARRGA
jgi:hypothetical protein